MISGRSAMLLAVVMFVVGFAIGVTMVMVPRSPAVAGRSGDAVVLGAAGGGGDFTVYSSMGYGCDVDMHCTGFSRRFGDDGIWRAVCKSPQVCTWTFEPDAKQ